MMGETTGGATMFGRSYNLPLAGLWLLVLVFVLARELILPPEVAAKVAGPQGWIAAIVAGGFAVYNFARWWATRSLRNRAVQVNPLAERLPDPDRPEPKWEPNPELDFTKRDEKTT
jgi:hypothetical protein